jgi:hypothetical protein
MVCVRQENSAVHGLHLLRCETLHGAFGTDWHKHRCEHIAMRKLDSASSCMFILFYEYKLQGWFILFFDSFVGYILICLG